MQRRPTASTSQQTLPASASAAGSAGAKTIEITCGAITHMDQLSQHGSWQDEVDARYALGEKQSYCAVCQLCRWPEEQRTCPHWKPSPELDAYYEEQIKL
jgi:hypothetical protein